LIEVRVTDVVLSELDKIMLYIIETLLGLDDFNPPTTRPLYKDDNEKTEENGEDENGKKGKSKNGKEEAAENSQEEGECHEGDYGEKVS